MAADRHGGGRISSVDPEGDDTFTYTLVEGDGDDDNASFTIDGRRLLTAEVFDYAVKSSYSIRVRSTDEGEEYLEEQFTIAVLPAAAGKFWQSRPASLVEEILVIRL